MTATISTLVQPVASRVLSARRRTARRRLVSALQRSGIEYLLLRSPDAEERRTALDRFYGAVHHQGSVYPATAVSLPFLFELAADGVTPDRAAVVALLVSINRESLDRGFEDDGTEIECYPPTGCAQAVTFLRARGTQFDELARDPDPDVRLAAIAGLGLFLDDAERAAALLRVWLCRSIVHVRSQRSSASNSATLSPVNPLAGLSRTPWRAASTLIACRMAGSGSNRCGRHAHYLRRGARFGLVAAIGAGMTLCPCP